MRENSQEDFATLRPAAATDRRRATIHSYTNDPNDIDDTEIYEPQWRIHQRFGDPAGSGLTAEISDGVNTVELTLAP